MIFLIYFQPTVHSLNFTKLKFPIWSLLLVYHSVGVSVMTKEKKKAQK